MITEQKQIHDTDLKQPRALGPKWRVEEAYLVGCVERERCVMVLSETSFLLD